MGIPGLTARLRPYAKTIQWQKRTSESQEAEAAPAARDRCIIDGPALAYYIYHRCLASHTDAHHALGALPSYHELAQAVVAWLEEIETFGLFVHRIFFDGYLPEKKTTVRSERLQKSLTQLRSFRAAHADFRVDGHEVHYAEHGRRPQGSPALFVSRKTPAKVSALPAMAFLVPVVIEALLAHSRYAKVTSVVPGEADTFCAEETMKSPQCIVMTSDSDLLVLCAERRIVMLHDLQFDGNGVLKALCYTPAEMASSGSTANSAPIRFRDIGYWMAQDPELSLRQCTLQLMSPSNKDIADLADTWYNSEMCAVPEEIAARLSELNASRAGGLMSALDPRISELVCDWWILRSRNARSGPAGARTSVRMCMPFLIDDPSRASAWRPSLDVRRLAYSVLALVGPSFEMTEIDRRGERFTANAVLLYSRQEMQQTCEGLLASLKRSDLPTRETKTVSSWCEYGILSTLEMLRESGSELPALSLVQSLTKSMAVSPSWLLVHFKAQVEGLLYSLRMLCMLLAILDAQLDGRQNLNWPLSTEGEDGLGPVHMGELKAVLSSMPALRDLMTSPNQGFPVEGYNESFRHKLGALYAIPLGEEQDGQEDGQARRKRAKKQRRRERRDAPKAVASKTGSRFNLLEEA